MIKLKEGFKNERTLSLSEKLIDEYQKEPLIRNLYIRKIGYFPQAKFHFIQKTEGCDYAILIYCLKGEGWYNINGQTYSLQKNHFIILPPGSPYTFGSSPHHPWSIYWLHFQGEHVHRFVPHKHTPQLIQPDDTSRIQDRLQLFEEIYHSFSMNYIKEYMIYSCMCLYQFLSSFVFLKQYRTIRSHPANPSFSGRVIRYMQENIQQILTIKQLAEHFKYSPSHLSMLFQKEIGTSPIHYFTQLKMQEACHLIEFTNLKINDIANKLGFEDPAYFSRVFSQIIGISPSKYRHRESSHQTDVNIVRKYK